MTKKNSKPRRKLKVRSNNYFTWNFRTSDYAFAKKYAAKKGMSMVELPSAVACCCSMPSV